MKMTFGFMLGALLVAGCGTSSFDGADAISEGGTDASISDGSTDAKTDAIADELDGAACPDALTPFKSCTNAGQCAIEATGNCCGDPMYVGVSGLSVADYQRCFPVPDCSGVGCATGTNCQAEDGKTASCAVNTDALGVACKSGLCESYIIADGGDAG